MTTNRMPHILTTAGILIALASAGCVGPTPMTPAASSPFSQGEVDASYHASGNGAVSVTVKHLGAANKLDKHATTYVVWLTPDGTTDAQNVGALLVDGDMEGKYEFRTSFKKFTLTVSPESSAAVTRQSGASILSAQVVAN